VRAGGEGDFAASSFIALPEKACFIDSNPGEYQTSEVGMTNSKAQMANKIQSSNVKSIEERPGL